jgi:nucleoside-diphosphate-sugar epimerase
MIVECINRISQDCLRILDNKYSELDLLRNSNLVVIGGTGFVGTWIAEMVSVLNDSFGFGINLSLISRSTDRFSEQIPHIANRSDVTLINSDVRNLINFPSDADWVIHAAANPDVRTHASNPLETASVIVDGTMSVLRTAERLGQLKKLLYISSGLVNASQLDNTQEINEDFPGAPPAEASFIYPNAKRFSETICSAARAQSRIPVLVARPFSFIGPYQSLDNPWAQTTFLSDALKGHQIRIKGDGQVLRSYLYGSDVAFWFLKILVKGNAGDLVNVASSETVSLEKLAKEVAKNFKYPPDIIFNSAPRNKGRSEKLLADTNYAKNQYGLTTLTPFDEAVRLTVEWHSLKN